MNLSSHDWYFGYQCVNFFSFSKYNETVKFRMNIMYIIYIIIYIISHLNQTEYLNNLYSCLVKSKRSK